MRLIDVDELKKKAFGKRGGLIHTKDIDDAPTVDAVPVAHGYWKAVTDDGIDYKRICSCCGEEAPFDESEDIYLIYPHCPWCGARNGVRGQ